MPVSSDHPRTMSTSPSSEVQPELLLSPDGHVLAGTTQALVKQLIAPDECDPSFVEVFMATFKSFMTANELVDALISQYEKSVASDADEQNTMQSTIRAGVIEAIKLILSDIEQDDRAALFRMEEFISQPDVVKDARASELLRLVALAQSRLSSSKKQDSKPAAGAVTKTENLSLRDIDPLELAQQLTLMDAALFKRIRRIDCLKRMHGPGSTERISDSVTPIIALANKVAEWVGRCVLFEDDPAARAATVTFFISIADHCRTLQNLSSMVNIISGLNAPPVRRLQDTWQAVSETQRAQMLACEAAVDVAHQFTAYRTALARIEPPCVPFIGVTLTLLAQITTSHSTSPTIPSHMIDFAQLRAAYPLLQDLSRWQYTSYDIAPSPGIAAFLERALNGSDDIEPDVFELLERSFQLEARRPGDEKLVELTRTLSTTSTETR
ncbi:hypothetical protein CERSUDRAFT_140118 [Gelatoporia subvermispora B]|uniref:Ras-GEF domain-containing protein n=1 Tax=Ceriporiopsis subvermispora (strain B) TaxID=914234 RepID=M2R823_CERS8|nr:hypothetical protein CERSUDRAFT_140118 [Gelatoporia subvermispora B]